MRYSGPEGGGSLRLVLRLRGPGDFQLLTADTLGRARWSLQMRQGTALLLDHQQKTACAGGDEVHFGERSLTLLPIAALPRLLLGELPVGSVESDLVDGSTEIRESVDRKWSVRQEAGQLEAWTLWIAELPTLWWTRQSKGGILSHRDGSQFRWRLVVAEPLAPVPDLVKPDDYRRIPCHEYDLQEFHQDQPAPPGSGPSSRRFP